MGKGNVGTRRVDKTHSQRQSVIDSDVMVLVTASDNVVKTNKTREILERLGNGKVAIDNAFRLIDLHVQGQPYSEDLIAYELQHDKSVKKVFSDIDKISRKYIELSNNNNSIYRGGSNRGIESWTTNSHGVDLPDGGHIYPDKSMKIDSIPKDYYIIQGVTHSQNFYGENEVTLLRKNAKASENYSRQRRHDRRATIIVDGKKYTRSEATRQYNELRKGLKEMQKRYPNMFNSLADGVSRSIEEFRKALGK